MIDKILVSKDEGCQKPIPDAWRRTFFDIADALKDGDYKIERGIDMVRSVSEADAVRIARNIDQYGFRLTSLPVDVWQTSVCQWMRGYWDVLIDLFTVEEGASDLALFVRVYEDGSSYLFEIQSVHVP